MVGVVIGTRVFLKGAIITQLVGTPSLALAAWVAAGLLSLAGALTYAELGAMLPETGGEYVFLRAAYGRSVAFQYGWMRVIVGGSTMAAVATSFATFFGSLVNLGGDWLAVDRQVTGHAIHWAIGARQLVALVVIGAVAIINSIGVKASGRTQTVLAVIKVSAVALIIVGVFTMSTTGEWTHFRGAASRLPVVASSLSKPAAFGAAVVGAMWAYTGWSYLPDQRWGDSKPAAQSASGDHWRHARGDDALHWRQRRLLLRVVSERTDYSQLHALSDGSGSRNQGCRDLSRRQCGEGGDRDLHDLRPGYAQRLDALHASRAIRHGARWAVLLHLRRAGSTVARACVWNCGRGHFATVLAVSGTYDQLTDFAVFAYAILRVLTAIGLFVLRRTMPDAVRPYRTFGYPWVPLAFAVTSACLVINMIQTSPLVAWLALSLLACGVPAYLAFRHRAAERDAAVAREPLPRTQRVSPARCGATVTKATEPSVRVLRVHASVRETPRSSRAARGRRGHIACVALITT